MIRLDKFLFENKYFNSRTKARESILNMNVKVDNNIITKPSFLINEQNKIEILRPNTDFVNRAGVKLQKAVEHYNLSLNDLICLDIGASKGGFTDVMLKCGAKKVYALDVGKNQLDNTLLENEKVISIENCNARYIDKSMFYEDIDFISMDVSFISACLIIPAISNILNKGKKIITLIKPQFEVGKNKIPKNGVVKNEKDRKFAIEKVKLSLLENNFKVYDEIISPISGSKGNIEYLILAEKI
ncbi:MAG: TlyA family rRNA (cytidine-2'-O)-methyltransferase [Clostridiales bacterium]|nr:MAG: TlyA family rRNA (cytidine-2'-O)-methyltransferase [Clostridiales bacterium]